MCMHTHTYACTCTKTQDAQLNEHTQEQLRAELRRTKEGLSGATIQLNEVSELLARRQAELGTYVRTEISAHAQHTHARSNSVENRRCSCVLVFLCARSFVRRGGVRAFLCSSRVLLLLL